MEQQKISFIAPTGNKYTIREQTGADEDILSNVSEARNSKNISNFLASIIVSINDNQGPFTGDQVHSVVPLGDRAYILIKSRIQSISEIVNFKYTWKINKEDSVQDYGIDITQFLLDFSREDLEVQLNEKPDAIKPYPFGTETKDLKFTLTSGKEIMFDVMTGESEAYIMNLPEDKLTKGQELISRNLRLKVKDSYEKVQNFQLFSKKDMAQMRKVVSEADPTFLGIIDIEEEKSKTKNQVSLMAIPDFFYPEEI